MRICRTWALHGPNLWAGFPVFELEVDLEELKDRPSDELPGFSDRLKAWLPSLIEHRCSVGERGGFFQRLDRGTWMAHILEHVALELQTLAGSEVGFGKARETDVEGVYRVAIEFEVETLGRAAIDLALKTCLAAVANEPFDLAAEIETLRELAYDVRLGPSTGAIVRAAKRRRIPHIRLNDQSLVQFGHGARLRRILAAETDRTSAIAESIAQDKELTRRLLLAAGAPLPAGRPVENSADAWRAAEELGVPVVVKPQYGNHGRGVVTNIFTREQMEAGYAAAREEGRQIVVEKMLRGSDFRLLVIDGKLAAAAHREPPHVVGDGRSTVEELVAEINRDPRRTAGHGSALSKIKLDPIAITTLAEQDCSLTTVLPSGKRILLRRNANLSTGGTAADVTDIIHPDTAALAEDAARVVGLDIAGIDAIVEDITQPIREQGGGFVEVNAAPGLRMHLEPSSGTGRPVGEAIIASLFPPADAAASPAEKIAKQGRIPLFGMTGGRGLPLAARLLARCLMQTRSGIGLASSSGLILDSRVISKRESCNFQGARGLLMNPSVEAAVLECSPESILREGLAYDRAWAGVIVDAAFPGLAEGSEAKPVPYLETVEQYVRVVRTVADATLKEGFVVLNADDPDILAIGEELDAATILFSRHDRNEAVLKGIESGKKGVFVSSEGIVLAAGIARDRLPLASKRIPVSDTEIPALLAAVAAAWGFGIGLSEIAAACETHAV